MNTKFRVGDKVRVINKLPNNPIEIGHIGTIKAINPLKFDYIYMLDNNTCYLKEEWLVKLPNRSKVGKKAYKTFLKNGGSRNSKGQFSKKQEIDWEKIGKELSSTYFNGNNVFESKENVKAFAKVFQKHGLIDKGVEI